MSVETTQPEETHKDAPQHKWVIMEIMGHRKIGGRLSEEVLAGTSFLRMDIPKRPEKEADEQTTLDWYATQYYGGSSIFSITVVTEKVARQFAYNSQPLPATEWELRLPAPASASASPVGYAADDDDDDDDIEDHYYIER
jgi:hypothetical protein